MHDFAPLYAASAQLSDGRGAALTLTATYAVSAELAAAGAATDLYLPNIYSVGAELAGGGSAALELASVPSMGVAAVIAPFFKGDRGDTGANGAPGVASSYAAIVSVVGDTIGAPIDLLGIYQLST